MSIIALQATDSAYDKNIKKVIKMLLFEILHEDALPASKNSIHQALLRQPGQITPFERLEDNYKVFYVMEPGATTLAYVFRKLIHDFYDQPHDRYDYIVAPEYRTRENILIAALKLAEVLELSISKDLLIEYVNTDYGFPQDFRNQLVRDLESRPGEVEPLNT